jgi:hypothetical protein
MAETHMASWFGDALLRGRPAVAVLAGAVLLEATPAVALTEGPSPSAASANTLKLPDAPGSIRGLSDQASVEVFTGQIGYSLPIDLPHAAQGFAPSLALSYSGALGNGPLGIGWMLSEIAIRRSLRDGVPSYTDADELELTGIGPSGRLIEIADGTFRIEGQGNLVKVVRNGNRFEVRDSTGTQYVLGATSEGRQSDGERVSAWLVQWITDVAGQRIEFSYEHDENEVYLSRVMWGPDAAFELELGRSERPDAVISYRTGFRVITAERLENLSVRSYGRTFRTYELSYDDSLPLSRLHGVHMTGLDGELALPDLTFSYAVPEPAKAEKLENTSDWVLNQRSTSLFDVDGDGMADLLRLEAGNHQYKKNRGGTFAEARDLSGANGVDLEGTQLMDLNGDARSDLVVIVDDTWRVYGLDGETWQPRDAWSGTTGVALQAPDTVLCDVNGDGRTDVLTAKTGGIGVRLAHDSGLSPQVTKPPIDPSNVQVTPGAADVRFADVNGDGLVDAVWLTDEWMKIYLGIGDGSFVPHTRAFYPWRDGDGASIGVLQPSDIHLADLDRDGVMDLIVVTAANVAWFRGRPVLGTFETLTKLDRPDGTAIDSVVTVADANGNGSEDVVWSSPTGIWVLDFAGSTSAGMLAGIENGLGKSSSISYSASAVLAVQAENAGEPWTTKLPVSVPVPISMIDEPGGGEPSRAVEYGVRDGFWDAEERRFGGFLVGRQAQVAESGHDTLIEETDFQPGLGDERVLRGKPWRVTKSDALGRVFSVQKLDHRSCRVVGLHDEPLLRRPVVDREELINLEGVSTPISTVATYEYDQECRRTVQRQLGRSDLSDEKIVRRRYVDNTALWVRDLVCEERIFEGDDQTVVSETRTLYGTDTTVFPLCSNAGFGWVRQVDQRMIFGAEDQFVTRASSTYDAVGNPLTEVNDGITRELVYDTTGIFVISETLPGAGLSWTARWDTVQQVMVEMTGPSQDTATITWDALGRRTSVALNGAPPFIHSVYDWEAPNPRTTSWVFDGPAASLQTEPWPEGAGWRQTISVANGNGEQRYSATRLADDWIVSGFTRRDARGFETEEVEEFYASAPLDIAPPMSARRILSHYDALGRRDRRTLPNGAEESVSFSAFQWVTTKSGLAPVTTVFDGIGRVVHTERGIAETGFETADISYDALDRVTTILLQKDGATPLESNQSVPPVAAVTHAFQYDTLGRLRRAEDPDIGVRELFYDEDKHELLSRHVNGAGQNVYFDYDDVGRLTRRGESPIFAPTTDYRYVYDDPSSALGSNCRVEGQLAEVLEPEGNVRFCYDSHGRQTARSHRIRPMNGTTPLAPERLGTERKELSPSGLELRTETDDGFVLLRRYDGAGRMTAVEQAGAAGLLWIAEEIDAAGRIVRERFGNGVVQHYAHDALGMPSDIRVASPGGGADLFHVIVEERTPYGAPMVVTDQIHPGAATGLDQTQSFTYDQGGRLVEATVGRFSATSDDQFAFSYRYDALQNMVFRQVCGPKDIGILRGAYQYGGGGYGPRQLTSVAPGELP